MCWNENFNIELSGFHSAWPRITTETCQWLNIEVNAERLAYQTCSVKVQMTKTSMY